MPYAALERMLRPERHRQRAAPKGGFSTPSMCFTSVGEEAMPLLSTNMRGNFRLTRRNAEGLAPFGFSFCPVGQEGPLLDELHRTLWELSTHGNWTNRCTGVPEAIALLQTLGMEPKSLVISERQLSGILGSDSDLEAARSAMAFQGYVTVVNGMQLLLSDLPDGSAMVAGPPSDVGIYTRVGDHLGLQLQRVNRAIVVVRPHVA